MLLTAAQFAGPGEHSPNFSDKCAADINLACSTLSAFPNVYAVPGSLCTSYALGPGDCSPIFAAACAGEINWLSACRIPNVASARVHRRSGRVPGAALATTAFEGASMS
jgi:hypothetical protein